MAPRLSIPVTANLDDFKSQMNEAANDTGRAVKRIVSEFLNVNDALKQVGEQGAKVGAQHVRVAGMTAARWAAVGVAIYATARAIGAVVSEARQQIEEMVAIADKAAARGVSPEFFQAFTAAGKGAVDQVKILEAALENAFRNTRQRLDPTVSPILPDVAKQNEFNEAATRTQQIQQTTAALAISQAETLEERQLATLKNMQEMIDAGRTLSALDIGEKLFGRELINNIEIGKTSINEIIKTIETRLARTAGREIFDNETVRQAKELDDRLKDAWRTIEDNLNPSMTLLGTIATGLKTTWVGIVELMAKASNLLPKFQQSRAGAFVGPSGETDFMNPPGEQTGAIGSVPTVTVRKAALKPFTLADVRGAIGPTPPERPETGAAAASAFDQQVDSINKHIAALEADAAAVGKTAAQHAVLRAELALLQAVEREGGEITNEQITAYARLRGEMEPLQAMQAAGIKLTGDQAKAFEQVTKRLGEAATSAESAKERFKALNEAIQFGGSQLVDIFDALTSKTKDFGKTMESVLNAFKRALLEALLVGQGPLAGLLGTKSGVPGGTGGILGDIVSAFGGAKAGGGDVQRGKWYVVGEHGPEIFAPSTNGTIIPDSPSVAAPSIVPSGVRSGAGGAGAFNVVIENHGAEVEQKGSTRNQSGGFDFRVAVRSVMKEAHAGGDMDDVMSRYGSAPRGVGR